MDENSPSMTPPPLGRPLGSPLASSPSPADEPDTQQTLRQPDAQSQQTIISTPSRGKKPSDGRKWLILCLSLLVIAAISGGVYYFLNQKDTHAVDDGDDDMELAEEDEDVEDEQDADAKGTYTVREADEQPRRDEVPAAEHPTPPVAPDKLFLSGDADGWKLTLSLQLHDGNRVTGTYTNIDAGTTMQLQGTLHDNQLTLTGTADHKNYKFTIVPEGHIYTGTLEPEGGLSQQLHLVEQQ